MPRKGYKFERCKAGIHWLTSDNIQLRKHTLKDGTIVTTQLCVKCKRANHQRWYRRVKDTKVWWEWGLFLVSDPTEVIGGIPVVRRPPIRYYGVFIKKNKYMNQWIADQSRFNDNRTQWWREQDELATQTTLETVLEREQRGLVESVEEARLPDLSMDLEGLADVIDLGFGGRLEESSALHRAVSKGRAKRNRS